MLNKNILIKKKVSLKDKNWFETGGFAEYFSEPKNINDFIELVNFSKKKNLKITILGSGANVLISDKGIKGLVIKPFNKLIEIENENNNEVFLKVDSGVDLEYLINFCLENNFLGLEEFSGIPGKIGGCVYINIHYFSFLISQFIVKGTILDLEKNEIKEVDFNWFEFSYNNSKLLTKKYCLINITFKLKKCSKLESEYAKGRSFEIIRHRKQRYPYKGTCGSFFRNFKEDEIKNEINGKKIIYAAYYLDNIGTKGNLKIGDASVSHKHANMIVNNGKAKSTDIINLAKKMQKLVWKKFKILLKTECEFLGFKKFPLYEKL